MEYFTLPNGLKIVCEQVPVRAECFGVAINAGSRDEDPHTYGLAHFVEHTIFKGTIRRRASHIINRMEAVGGELNAFTSKEETNVYSIFPSGNLPRAVELIADLLRNSVFPEKELQKEREVVREEIDSYLDTPSEAIFDDFENLFFRDSQLGHNILGEETNLDRFTPEICRRYITTHYHPSGMVAFYRGATSPAKAAALITRHFSAIAPSGPNATRRIQPAILAPFTEKRSIGSHQAHCIMGAHLPGIYSDERLALGLLTNILGGPGMNSRLNVALREKRGLVYSAEANMTLFSDCGLFAIYFGSDPSDCNRCVNLVRKELDRLTSAPLSLRAINAARQQYLGQLIVASDNNEQMALNAGRAMLYFGHVTPADELRDRILAITPDQLLHTARHLRPHLFSTLILS